MLLLRNRMLWCPWIRREAQAKCQMRRRSSVGRERKGWNVWVEAERRGSSELEWVRLVRWVAAGDGGCAHGG